MSSAVYNAQCMNGHAFSVPHGTDMEEEARLRVQSGALDALMVSTEECPECQEDNRESAYRFASMCAEVGCALMDEETCKNGCRALRH